MPWVQQGGQARILSFQMSNFLSRAKFWHGLSKAVGWPTFLGELAGNEKNQSGLLSPATGPMQHERVSLLIPTIIGDEEHSS